MNNSLGIVHIKISNICSICQKRLMSYDDIIPMLPCCQKQVMSDDDSAVLLAETFLAFDNMAYVLCTYLST